MVITGLVGGIVLLGAFGLIETRVAQPIFRFGLFKIQAVWAGNVAALLNAIARGGLQFMLIIWLQGIWLPLHSYSFESIPLWAGIYLLPLTIGFVIAGPVSGFLSDRYGAKTFATGGLVSRPYWRWPERWCRSSGAASTSTTRSGRRTPTTRPRNAARPEVH